jgi:hypothetical protein
MMLLLRRSGAQAAALDRALGEMRDPASPHYREWLTPASYGAKYGISDADLSVVTGWLKGQGFTIERVPEARNVIVFSGTVGTVEKAFHTSIHRYLVAGVEHYANASDPQIPAALAPVVAGISPMNDFRARPQHEVGARGAWDPASRRIKPQLTLEGGTSAAPVYYLYADPADAATIYNTPNSTLNAKYAGSKSLDGTGVTIGILGYADLNTSDVGNYRQAFLNQSYGQYSLNLIVDGDDPDIYAGGDAVEALLDTEVSGGLAPGATINYYSAASTDLTDGLQLAALRAIDDNQVSILSVSYGNCEAELGVSGNQLFAELWGQAASQGITVVVSSGDSGSAACDDDNSEELATQGLAVSGLASTPYNIAVGGTDFDGLPGDFAMYVNSSTGGAPPYYGTALGYIPESTWNDSVVSDGSLSGNVAYGQGTAYGTNIIATGGGASCAVFPANPDAAAGVCSGTLTGYPKPAYQNAVTASDKVRDMPDVSLFSANGKYQATWVLCSDNSTDGVYSQSYTNCQGTDGVLDSGSNFDGVGGTSASAPAFAGILALVSQSLGGVRLGQANNVLYNLAHGSSAGSIFHSVAGNNSVPCAAGSVDCLSNGFLSGYNAGGRYSEAAGLGSVNVTALVNAWPSAVFTSTATSLEVGTSAGALGTGGVSVTHGMPLYFGVGVTPAGAVGSVSVTNTSGVTNNAASSSDMVTLGSNSTGTFSANNLPGGTYTVSAYYAGDATHAASTSSPINVTVGQEPSTTALTLQIFDPATGKQVSGTAAPYGYYLLVNAQPYGNNSTRNSQGNIVPDGVASGNVSFSLSGSANSEPVNSQGYAEYSLTGLIPSSYVLQASYGGDASLGASTSNTLPLTVSEAKTTLSLAATATSIAANGSVTVTLTLAADSVGQYPNYDIALMGNGISFPLNSVQEGGSPYGTMQIVLTFVVPGSQLATGANVLTASFADDGYYLASTGAITVNVSAPTPSFTLAGPTSGITIAAPGQGGTGTLTLSPANGFTGTVSLSCSVSAASGGVAPSCSVPSSVAVTGTGPVTAVLSVSTTAGTAANRMPLERWFARGAGVALGWVVLLWLPRRRGWPAMAALLLLLGGAGAIGCGGGGSSSTPPGSPGTPVGTYTVTVSGTSGTITASTSVTVTLQ